MVKDIYQSYPANQKYRLELPNGQQGYDFGDKIIFTATARQGDKGFTYKELVYRGYKWVFDYGFAIPTND